MPETAIPPFQTRPLAMHLVAGFCLGEYDYRIIGDACELTQFGVQIEVSPSQKKLSLHHWHQANDEVVHMLSGEVFLLEEDEKIGAKVMQPVGQQRFSQSITLRAGGVLTRPIRRLKRAINRTLCTTHHH